MTDTPIPFKQKPPPPRSPGTGVVAIPRRFTVGQIVWLKSGSPALTVSDLNSTTPSVTVDWFDVEHVACRDAFHQDQLADHPHLWPSSVAWPMVPPALAVKVDGIHEPG